VIVIVIVFSMGVLGVGLARVVNGVAHKGSRPNRGACCQVNTL